MPRPPQRCARWVRHADVRIDQISRRHKEIQLETAPSIAHSQHTGRMSRHSRLENCHDFFHSQQNVRPVDADIRRIPATCQWRARRERPGISATDAAGHAGFACQMIRAGRTFAHERPARATDARPWAPASRASSLKVPRDDSAPAALRMKLPTPAQTCRYGGDAASADHSSLA
jgi:hypothetical protein